MRVSLSVRILVPLSEKKVAGGRPGLTLQTHRNALKGRLRHIAKPRRSAIDAFRRAMNGGNQALKVLGLTGKPFQEALGINRCFDCSPMMPTIERHARAFADALLLEDLPADSRRRLERQLFFLCPLLGILSPRELLPDFRCPAGARLPVIGSLHRFWKPEITTTLNRLFRRKLVISFLPARLNALWKPDGAAASIAIVRFSRLSNKGCAGETAAVPGLTGEAVRFILENAVTSVADLVRFRSSSGHTYSAAHSDREGGVRHLTFVR